MFAAIDIGTNSVLLTIAKKEGDEIKTVYEGATITRIGEGVGKSGNFNKAAMERTLAVLQEYASLCKKHAVEKIYAVGTAAFRRAKNAPEFMESVKKICGFDIEIISGEREAALTLTAVEKDFGSDIVIVDIGGGSTELIIHTKGRNRTFSLPLGCVTLQEKFGKSDPINRQDFESMKEAVQETITKNVPPRYAMNIVETTSLIATAGTATTLAAIKLKLKKYNHAEVHSSKLGGIDLLKIEEDLRKKAIKERKKIVGLEPKRADVIFPGVVILKAFMDYFGFDKVTVSDRGVRWGLLYEILEKNHPS